MDRGSGLEGLAPSMWAADALFLCGSWASCAINHRPTRGSISPSNSAGLISEVSEEVTTQIAKNCPRRQLHCHLRPPPRVTPANIRMHPIFPETRVIGLHFCRWQYGCIFIQICAVCWPFKVVQGHPRSTILVPIESAYTTVVVGRSLWLQSYLAPLLRSDSFYVLLTPPLFHPNFGGVPVAPDCPCWGQRAHGPWAISPWNYFRSIQTCVQKNIPQRHGQTDGWTDEQTTCNLITALCVASRGNKTKRAMF